MDLYQIILLYFDQFFFITKFILPKNIADYHFHFNLIVYCSNY